MAKRKLRIKGKRGDPLLIFINAQGFHRASRIIDAQPTKSILFWPMMANESFALELHIKCLHRLRRRAMRRWHNTHELYSQLGRRDRRKIAAYLLEIARRHPRYLEFFSCGVKFDPDSVAQRASDMFTKARYWHELDLPSADSQGHVGNIGISSLSDAIAKLILELRPEWKDKLANFRLKIPKTGLLPT